MHFAKICRACLSSKPEMESLFINGTIDIFKSCASVQIEYGDGLPTLICQQCLDQMNLAYSFRQICQQSDKMLRLQGYLPLQVSEPILEQVSCSEFPVSELLEAEVIFANMPEDESSINAQRNAERIMNFMSDDEEPGYLDDIGLEPECNLIENALAALEGEIQLEDKMLPAVDNVTPWNISINKQIPLKTQNITLPSKNSNVEYICVCDHCNVKFRNKDDLEVHMSIHVENGKYQCNRCLKCYSKMPKLKRHIKTHASVKNHRCQACGKEFTEACALNKHYKRHMEPNEKQHVCRKCGKLFRYRDGLKSHTQLIHSSVRPFPCPKCARAYATKSLLSAHMRTHNQNQMHQCSICTKQFKHKSHLNTHMKIHTGDKPYNCEICNKSFIQQSHLKTHLHIHAGFRPYVCGLCPAKFTTSSQLNAHQTAHTKQRPYQCSVCGKKFARSEGMLLHMRTHTGEKPYPCPLCPKTFISASKRNRHLDSHSRVKYYDCNECDIIFAKITDLNKHKKQHKQLSSQYCYM